VNVKIPTKGRRLRDPLQEPITCMDGVQIAFLGMLVDWLDAWRNLGFDTGMLTQDTHTALRLTSHSLIELTRHCIGELGLSMSCLGNFRQTILKRDSEGIGSCQGRNTMFQSHKSSSQKRRSVYRIPLDFPAWSAW
ncbi:unnamed protein product, partial [Ixodes hexagonus]